MSLKYFDTLPKWEGNPFTIKEVSGTKKMRTITCKNCNKQFRIETKVGRCRLCCTDECADIYFGEKQRRYNQKYCASPRWKKIRKQRRDAKKEQENA